MDIKLELGDINESVNVDEFRNGFIGVVAGDTLVLECSIIQK